MRSRREETYRTDILEAEKQINDNDLGDLRKWNLKLAMVKAEDLPGLLGRILRSLRN